MVEEESGEGCKCLQAVSSPAWFVGQPQAHGTTYSYWSSAKKCASLAAVSASPQPRTCPGCHCRPGWSACVSCWARRAYSGGWTWSGTPVSPDEMHSTGQSCRTLTIRLTGEAKTLGCGAMALSNCALQPALPSLASLLKVFLCFFCNFHINLEKIF